MAAQGTDLQKAAGILQKGGLVAIPTETVYGLAANALNEKAVARIYEAKKRPNFDPLIVHVSGFNQALKYARIMPPLAERLAERFWPGPLTMVMEKSNEIPYLVSAGLETVGLRAPRHPLTAALLNILPFPLAAPSANPFGYISPTTAEHVQKMLGEEVDYILDGGPCDVGIESTVIRVLQDEIIILRKGGITADDLRKLNVKLSEQIVSGSNPASPGQLSSHYAPRCKVILGKISCLLKDFNGMHKTALITFNQPALNWPAEHQFVLAPDGLMNTAAANLFKALHWLDDNDYELAYCERVPETGVGTAINDRLNRAAY